MKTKLFKIKNKSRKREAFTELAPMLWHSFGSIAALLQEVISVYSSINPPTLTAHMSSRICNALALVISFILDKLALVFCFKHVH